MSNFIYGVVLNNIFYSNKMEYKLSNHIDNGIYSIDMDEDDFKSTLSPADIEEARKFFKKASKIILIRGISFHDSFIPENPISYKTLPIKVIDATYDEFEEIEVVNLKGIYYYIQTIAGNKSYLLMDIKELFSSKKEIDISTFKDLTPSIRLVCMFHLIERKKKEMEEPVSYIKNIMTACGAMVHSVLKKNIGYEVVWEYNGYKINTLLDKQYGVSEAGFCVSGSDKILTARAVVNVLKDFVKDGDHVHKTRII